MSNENTRLMFKWSVSKGRDTYGYNICSLYVDGKKMYSCNGGGYDMTGTCLADWIKDAFTEELKTIKSNRGGDDKCGFYGLSFFTIPRESGEKSGPVQYHQTHQEGDSISLDGACGFTSMERILDQFGYHLFHASWTSKQDVYVVMKNTKE